MGFSEREPKRTHTVTVHGDNSQELEAAAVAAAQELWGSIPCTVVKNYNSYHSDRAALDGKQLRAYITVEEA